jgi:polyisoprenoid-binding protein YceI
LKSTPVLAGLIAAAFATVALAQAPAPAAGGARPAPPAFVPEKDPSKVRDGAYVVEPDHTRTMFGISHKSFTTFYGEFRDLTGSLNLNVKNPTASTLEIHIPVKTISTQIDHLNEELRHKPWLDADTWPEMTFKSTAVKVTGPGTADVTGDFSFHGQTHPLTLHVKFNAAGVDPNDKYYVAGFTVTGAFSRKAWGFSTGEPMIGDDIDLNIQAAFKKPA